MKEEPGEIVTKENCYRLGHVDVRVGQANLAKCELCGRAIYVQFPELGKLK